MTHARHTRSFAAALVCALVAATLSLVAAAPATAKVPQAPYRYGAKIEPLASYVGQSKCSPAAKPGTSAFARLLLRTYPSTRSLGISRACGAGGASEHKEGRAFDWGASVYNAQDRRAVDALLSWLLKTDKHGNRFAMARRLNIQYIIWNRRIWGAYSASSGWRKYTGASPHTDHVHFSLGWSGARKKSSFWNPKKFGGGGGPTPPPPTDPGDGGGSGGGHDRPDPTPDEKDTERPPTPEPTTSATLPRGTALVSEQVRVPANRRAGIRPKGALVAGHRYLVEATGAYRFAKGRQGLADAECSRASSGWTRDRSLRLEDWNADHLDLYLDGHDLGASADDDGSCDSTSHTYRAVHQAQRTGRPPLQLWDPDTFKDNSGEVVVRITDLDAPQDDLSWTVPADSFAGGTSPGALQGGRDYRVTVRGTWADGTGVTADAECTRTSGDAAWRRDREVAGDRRYDALLGTFGYGTTPRVEGVRMDPETDTGDDCDAARHRYTFVWRAERTMPLNLRVDDPGRYADNTGALTVRVRPHVMAEPPPRPVERETVQVDSRTATPVRTAQHFAAGTSLRLTVSGRYLLRYDASWVLADGECSITSSDGTWRSSRFAGHVAGVRQELGDVALNGRVFDWRPSDGVGSCDERNHVYTLDFVTQGDGPLFLQLADDVFDDNRGALTVVVEPR